MRHTESLFHLPYLIVRQFRVGGAPMYIYVSSPKWAFLFDKVMLLCKKARFDVRYHPKHVFIVSTLSVSVHPPAPRGGKVMNDSLWLLFVGSIMFLSLSSVFVCISDGCQRSGRLRGLCQDRGAQVSMDRCYQSCQVSYCICLHLCLCVGYTFI